MADTEEAAGHIASVFRTQNDEHYCAARSLLFLQSRTLAQGRVAPGLDGSSHLA